ncbi:MAG: glutathione S-transferase family protein [Gammaproteobacteria bacterium]|nr:glutathione S-transferase family protein [Gammaproteobacteria bacterium]
MLTLYHHPFSQHARRVAALLEQADIPYEAVPVALNEGAHKAADYLKINPNHQVPTLVDGDVKIHESNAILRYLCHKYSLTDWYPEDPAVRASVEQWLDWNQCRLSRSVIDIVLNKVFMGDDANQAEIARGEENMIELSAILGDALEQHRFLAGNSATIADLSVASNISQLQLADAAPDRSSIQAWYLRVCDIPGFRITLPKM